MCSDSQADLQLAAELGTRSAPSAFLLTIISTSRDAMASSDDDTEFALDSMFPVSFPSTP